jgi:hypothetical protein
MNTPLETTDYNPPHGVYVALVPTGADVLDVLRRQREELADLAAEVAPAREQHRYADGKWSIREVVGHLADAERIFGYRMLAASRGEPNPLPSFDENLYGARSNAHHRPLRDLLGELLALREANLALLRGLDEAAWSRQAVANNSSITARGMAHVIAGHCEHHLRVLHERYGVTRPATEATTPFPRA